jgi:hypothetical protein
MCGIPSYLNLCVRQLIEANPKSVSKKEMELKSICMGMSQNTCSSSVNLMGRGAMFMLLGRNTTSSTKRREINQSRGNLKGKGKQK